MGAHRWGMALEKPSDLPEIPILAPPYTIRCVFLSITRNQLAKSSAVENSQEFSTAL
jgi:hypothetical protein